MTFDKELNNAYKQKNLMNYDKALKLFEKLYSENPEGFTYQDRVNYAWTIIKTGFSKDKSEEEFLQAAEFITDLLPQTDLNERESCPYTTAVFKVLKMYNEDKNYIAMIPWLERLDPKLLDEESYRSYGMPQKSRREAYYNWSSMAYLDDFQLEKCIAVSRDALDTLKNFHHNSDTWFNWRIAKSLRQLNRLREALPHYMEVIKVKHDWYIYRDIAETYYRLNRPFEALDYLCPAVLSKEPLKIKMGIYYLCYNVFKLFNEEMAMKHAQLYFLLLKEKGYSVPYEIELLEIDETLLDKDKLAAEITGLWTEYKYRNEERHNGTIDKFFQNRGYGFIRDENDGKIFFHESEFRGDSIMVGQQVSFCAEESFDRSRNRKSIKAVFVRGE